MANATDNLVRHPIGKTGRDAQLPVDGGSHVFAGTMLAQLDATAQLVPGSTAAAGPCVGVAEMEQDNTAGADGDLRCRLENDRTYAFANATAGDACSEATRFGSRVYMFDDHTIADNDASGTRQLAGYFAGMEPDGKVRVYIPATREGVSYQTAGGTFANGEATISAGITVTADTDAFVVMSTAISGSANVGGIAHLKAGNVAGGPGTGEVTLNILGTDGATDADADGDFRVLLIG